eukprot:scaffold2195_cov127-Isochrysis_galbana.AAC.3
MEAHYTVMTSGLLGSTELVVSDQNMVAVSNPCALDPDLAPPGTLLIHAYGCGNEPYDAWEGIPRGGAEYERLKKERAEVLWAAVERVVPNARARVKVRWAVDKKGTTRAHRLAPDARAIPAPATWHVRRHILRRAPELWHTHPQPGAVRRLGLPR